MNINKLLLKTGILTIGGINIFSKGFVIDSKTSQCKLIIQFEDKNNNIELHKDDLSRYYARIFEIDEEIISKKMNELTESYKNWKLSYWPTTYKINDNEYKNEKEAILTTVRDIYNNPEKYNLTKEALETDFEYETSTICEDLVQEYCSILAVNKEIALSIIFAECGKNLDSYNYLNNNNPAGMGPYNYYNNIEHGIIEFIYLLKDSFKCNLNSDITFIYTISKGYCGVESSHWESMTSSFYYNLIYDYYYYAHDRLEKNKSKAL